MSWFKPNGPRRWVRPLKEYNPLWVGLVGAALIGALVLGSVGIGVLGIGDKRYEAEFAHTGGLRTGDGVRVAGMRVGEVTGTRLAGDRVVISFRTESDVDLGSSTKATIKLATLLGGRFLSLTPLGEGEPDNATIPLARTEVPFDLQKVIEEGGSAVRELNGEKLQESLKTLTDTFRDTPEVFGQALRGFDTLSSLITKREDQIGQLLKSADQVTTTMNAKRGQLFSLMGQADAVLGELVKQRSLIKNLLRDFSALSKELEQLLGDNRPQIEPLMKNIGGITEILNRNEKKLDRALELFGPTGRYLANAFGNGPYGDMYLPYAIFPDNALCALDLVEGCR